ncbi:hypothetical protein [Fimbriimonas ginsengisoli]|uniref:Uncharacterized protein n=1 Tax=Fimbriimonas ginsengisoli Gsoil 348 TaxID=661478 RepID=A0A068NTG1_FIMGI|nr:hypothetical protein [Fimbriimonas ginsengisoli]AIE84904.1 hypothetical protein OP10G_1536 [Fimbriimonas ginsengisoli Gsoil 348]
MTIGDVFSIVAAIFGIFLTSWATVVGVALLTPAAAERARRAIEEPKRALWRGFSILLPGIILSIGLLGSPLPLAKGLGWLVTLAWLALGAIGASGLAQAAGRRIQDLDPTMSAYPAICRGAAYVVGASILPVLGWFGFGPLLFMAAIGAGWKAVVRPRAQIEAGEAA